MSNGSPPTTIEAWPRLSTGRIGLVPPNVAAHLYVPVAPSGLVPELIEDDIQAFPVFSTNGVAIAQDAGIWIYQPNVPYGMIEIIPSLQPPTNVTAPLIVYVSGNPAGTVGAIYTCQAGAWTPTTPTPTYTRQWLRNGTPIAGATGTTYTIATADIGATIQCQVVATNPAGSSAPAMSSNSIGPIPDPEGTRQAVQQPQSHGKVHHASSVHRRGSGPSK